MTIQHNNHANKFHRFASGAVKPKFGDFVEANDGSFHFFIEEGKWIVLKNPEKANNEHNS